MERTSTRVARRREHGQAAPAGAQGTLPRNDHTSCHSTAWARGGVGASHGHNQIFKIMMIEIEPMLALTGFDILEYQKFAVTLLYSSLNNKKIIEA